MLVDIFFRCLVDYDGYSYELCARPLTQYINYQVVSSVIIFVLSASVRSGVRRSMFILSGQNVGIANFHTMILSGKN